MTILDAALALARAYPGGAKALGARMGKANLADELNPNCRGAKLGAEDMVTMELLARDYRCLYAHAEELRHYPPVPMPEDVDPQAEPCMVQLAKLAKEFGDLVSAVSSRTADGDVSANDMRAIEAEWQEMLCASVAMMAQLHALHARHARGGA